MAGDWVKIYREMIDHPIMQDDFLCRLWIWCLLRANFRPQRWKMDVIHPGQFITGRNAAAAELKVSPSKWYRGMMSLQAIGCIEIEANSKWTRVSVINWRTYQDSREPKRTASEQQMNTIEEGKKETTIVVSNMDSRKFTTPTIEEVREYCRVRGNSVDAEKFVSHYESNGWKVGKNPMKDWRAAIRTWEKNDYGSRSGQPGSRGTAAGANSLTRQQEREDQQLSLIEEWAREQSGEM